VIPSEELELSPQAPGRARLLHTSTAHRTTKPLHEAVEGRSTHVIVIVVAYRWSPQTQDAHRAIGQMLFGGIWSFLTLWGAQRRTGATMFRGLAGANAHRQPCPKARRPPLRHQLSGQSRTAHAHCRGRSTGKLVWRPGSSRVCVWPPNMLIQEDEPPRRHRDRLRHPRRGTLAGATPCYSSSSSCSTASPKCRWRERA
jgi:hypothetical protein